MYDTFPAFKKRVTGLGWCRFGDNDRKKGHPVEILEAVDVSACKASCEAHPTCAGIEYDSTTIEGEINKITGETNPRNPRDRSVTRVIEGGRKV